MTFADTADQCQLSTQIRGKSYADRMLMWSCCTVDTTSLFPTDTHMEFSMKKGCY